MGEKGIDLGLGHLGRMPDVAVEDELPDPVDVGLFGARAVMARAERLGETQGRGRHDRYSQAQAGMKGVYVLPLQPDWQRVLRRFTNELRLPRHRAWMGTGRNVSSGTLRWPMGVCANVC